MTSAAQTAMLRHKVLKGRLYAHEQLLSIFVKSMSPVVIEALEGCGHDFLILDAEHNPYDRASMDHCILAARSIGLPVLVRLPNHAADTILSVLDMGAAGIIAPHVGSPRSAEAIAGACKYHANGHGGARGVTSNHRAGGYGNYPLETYLKDSDEAVIVIAQIEDEAGVDAVDDICAVSGIDGLLVGPVDLRHALGGSAAGQRFDDAVSAVLTACDKENKAAGLFVPSASSVPEAADKGFSFFAISSEIGLLKSAIKADLKTAQ